MPRHLLVPAVLSLISACAGKAEETGAVVCEPGAVSAGTIEATVNGEAWLGTGLQWTPQAAGLQLTSAIGAGDEASPWRLTLVTAAGRFAVEGVAVNGQTPDESLPMDVTLDPEGAEGFALLYPAEGSSFATNAEGGSGRATLHAVDNDDLLGCVELTAAGADGTIELVGGRFRATRLDVQRR